MEDLTLQLADRECEMMRQQALEEGIAFPVPFIRKLFEEHVEKIAQQQVEREMEAKERDVREKYAPYLNRSQDEPKDIPREPDTGACPGEGDRIAPVV
jgi:hypothetical protein